MSDVKELLERLDALREKATAGPFYVERDESFPSNARADVFRLVAYESNRARKSTARPVYDATIYGNSNADFFVALVNAYPALRAALLEMRGENERLRDTLRDVVFTAHASSVRVPALSVIIATVDEALAKGGG